MPHEYATAQDLEHLEQKLYEHKVKNYGHENDPQFEGDVGDIGHLKSRVDSLEKIAGYVTGWKGIILFLIAATVGMLNIGNLARQLLQ